MNVDYHRGEISIAHRHPSSGNGDKGTSNIVVCFVSCSVKGVWIRTCRERKTFSARELQPSFPDQPIWMNDHLTKETSELFRKVRKLQKTNRTTSVWTSDGRVLAKRLLNSNHFRDLNALTISGGVNSGDRPLHRLLQLHCISHLPSLNYNK